MSEFIEYYFGYKTSMKGWTILIMLAYGLLFVFTSTICLKKLNWQKR